MKSNVARLFFFLSFFPSPSKVSRSSRSVCRSTTNRKPNFIPLSDLNIYSLQTNDNDDDENKKDQKIIEIEFVQSPSSYINRIRTFFALRILISTTTTTTTTTMMVSQQHDDLYYTFQSLILPPLYLSDSGIIDTREMMFKESVVSSCQKKCIKSRIIDVNDGDGYDHDDDDDDDDVAVHATGHDDGGDGDIGVVIHSSETTVPCCLSESSSTTSGDSMSSSSNCGSSSSSSHDGTTTTTTTTTTRKQPRVAFQRDRYGRTVVHEYPSYLDELTIEDRDAIWYKKHEYRYWKKYGKKLASVASDSKYGKDLEKVCKACSKAGATDVGTNATDVVDRYSKIANSTARGLEVMVAPHLLRGRKGTIRSVLKAQDRLPSEMPYPERAELLRATSCILSRSTKILARILGTGDANVADAYHREGS